MLGYDARGNGNGAISPTITGGHQDRVTDYTAIVCEVRMKKFIACDVYNQTVNDNAPTVTAAVGGANTSGCKIIEVSKMSENVEYIVRRLTPMECERLQGFPDNWTRLPHKADMTDAEFDEWQSIRRQRAAMDDKPYKPCKRKGQMVSWYNKMVDADSNRYRALGNSIALPQWWWLFNRMRPYLPERPTLGSLFDGIGGFPLTFEDAFGAGAAVWASEVEPFCIAVTKERFPGGD